MPDGTVLVIPQNRCAGSGGSCNASRFRARPEATIRTGPFAQAHRRPASAGGIGPSGGRVAGVARCRGDGPGQTARGMSLVCGRAAHEAGTFPSIVRAGEAPIGHAGKVPHLRLSCPAPAQHPGMSQLPHLPGLPTRADCPSMARVRWAHTAPAAFIRGTLRPMTGTGRGLRSICRRADRSGHGWKPKTAASAMILQEAVPQSHCMR